MRIIWLIVTFVPALSVALEPFSTTYLGYAAVASVAGYFYYNYDACEKKECCKHPWVYQHPWQSKYHLISSKTETISQQISFPVCFLSDYSQLYGQPLVQNMIIKVINRRQSYDRPLSLSFHGPTGTGKTFLSTLIADNLFKLGKESSFVHFFSVGYHFPNPSKVEELSLIHI